MALEIAKSYTELIALAKEAEQASDVEKAIKYYEKATRLEPLEPFAYNRLMIIYRKEKNYTAELNTINKGITKFLEDKKKKEEHFNIKHKQAAKLSRSLLKSLGSVATKDIDVNYPEPYHSWQKRKVIAEQRLSKKTSPPRKKSKN